MTGRPWRAIVAGAAIALVVSSCAFSPLAHRIKVGEEPFVIFVGEGRDGHTDLFAVSASGGPVVQVTFTALTERDPRLTSSGELVAFLRMKDTTADQPRDVVVVNLVSYAETVIALPAGAGRPRAVAWSDDGAVLFIRTDRGVWQAPASSGTTTPVAAKDTAVADSALELWLGRPRFTRVVPCVTGGLCVIGPKGDTTSLAPEGRDAIRWGNDSVGWFQQGGISVRSLGPSDERELVWQDGPAHPRDGSYARGAVPPAR